MRCKTLVAIRLTRYLSPFGGIATEDMGWKAEPRSRRRLARKARKSRSRGILFLGDLRRQPLWIHTEYGSKDGTTHKGRQDVRGRRTVRQGGAELVRGLRITAYRLSQKMGSTALPRWHFPTRSSRPHQLRVTGLAGFGPAASREWRERDMVSL